MGYEAIANGVAPAPAVVTPVSREAGKKKRTNRSAKLKQCKLDARRVQWLKQVKEKDDSKVHSTSPNFLPSTPRAHLPRHPWSTETMSKAKNKENERENIVLHNNSNSIVLMDKQRNGSLSHSISSGSSIGSSSRSVSDAEEEVEEYIEGAREEENGVLDDWEAVADALSKNSDSNHPEPGPMVPQVNPVSFPCIQNEAPCSGSSTKPETIPSIPRAWRPDDTSRPQTLPSISKQLSLDMKRQCVAFQHKGILTLPSPCPICCEDLDNTDSSFLPCSCGYSLCLFCHKRILETDSRCPGCRKQYDSKVVEVTVGANTDQLPRDLLFGLSRSFSMNSSFQSI